MRRPRGVPWTGATLLLIAAAAGSIDAAAQQRDRPEPATIAVKTGTAGVAGKVTLAADADTPVRRAVISLTSSDGTDHRSVVTDNDGRFAFHALPAGRYTLSAEKPAHLKNSYGARRPGRPGTALVVTEGQQITELRLALPRGAVITGTLKTAGGEPMPSTQVMAIPVALATAGGTSVGPAEFSTDDQGTYRIFGLSPGDYLVAALPTIGRGEVEERSEAEYEAIVRALSQRLAPGSTPAAAATTPAPITRGFAPTYYPGTPIPAQAVPISVGSGDIKDGIDIPITMFRMSTITGNVIGTDGAPTRAVQLTTEAIGPTLPLGSALSIRNNTPDLQGRFTITNVPPGSYRVTARAGGTTLSADGGRSVSTDAQTEWAVADVQIAGENVDGVTLTLQPGMTFAGRVTASGSGAGPDSWKGTRITVQPRRQVGPGVVMNGSPVSGLVARNTVAADDGAFVVTGIQPGDYEILVQPAASTGPAWTVRSMMAGMRDLRDSPLTFEEGSVANVAITLTDQPSIVTGTLSSAAGTPAADYYVVLFPVDRALWHPASPRVKVVRPGVDGAFSVRGLPAGEYRLAALTDVEENEWRSLAFLESLLATSITVTVGDGATTRQDVRIR